MFADRLLHGLAIELAVGLGARSAHRRTLGAVEQAELDSGLIGDAAHQPVQRIDLAHQMTLAESADGRIAGHLADRREAMGHQAPCARQAAPQRRPPRMPAWPPPTTMTSKRRCSCALSSRGGARPSKRERFHVKQKSYLPMQNSRKIEFEHVLDIDRCR